MMQQVHGLITVQFIFQDIHNTIFRIQ